MMGGASNLLSEQNQWEHWAFHREMYSEDFRTFVDSLGDIPPCPEDHVWDLLAKPYVVDGAGGTAPTEGDRP